MTELAADHIDALRRLLPDRESTTDADLIAPHCIEWRGKYQGSAPLMVMPSTTEHVAAVVRYCNAHRIAIVPQGGNTGLVGGGIPGLDGRSELLLSLKNMRAVGLVDAATDSLIAGAGATIQDVQAAASAAGRLFPLSLASEGTCTVGGTIATNAGGIHVIRYGTMRSRVMGLEYVLPSGATVSTLAPLMKDNTGYNLDPLIAGSEGTLAVITRARLRLAPPEVLKQSVWVGVRSIKDALKVLASARKAVGPQLSAFEALSSAAVDVGVRRTANQRRPIATDCPWHLLIEAGTSDPGAPIAETMMAWLTELSEDTVIVDAVIAQNERERMSLWALREGLSAAQKQEGASIKHDISIPLDRMSDFLASADALIQKMIPGARPTPFGHLGDGNLHDNILEPKDGDTAALLDRWDEVNNAIHTLTHEVGGSISAEHGIGRMRKADLKRLKNPDHYAAMHALKKALDPNGILNPGVLF